LGYSRLTAQCPGNTAPASLTLAVSFARHDFEIT
jgi:hypothetical protein